jgi:hypothetical protein
MPSLVQGPIEVCLRVRGPRSRESMASGSGFVWLPFLAMRLLLSALSLFPGHNGGAWEGLLASGSEHSSDGRAQCLSMLYVTWTQSASEGTWPPAPRLI